MVSKAGINSQSVNRLDALEEEGGAGLIGADNTNGLTGITVQAQINELATMSGGGDFKPSFFSGTLQIASGVSGDILTLTAPEGKKIRLTALIAGSAGNQPGVSIFSDGETVVDSLVLASAGSSASNVGNFAIGNAVVGSASVNGSGSGVLVYVEGSQIIINKSGGLTTGAINYSYAYGDYL